MCTTFSRPSATDNMVRSSPITRPTTDTSATARSLGTHSRTEVPAVVTTLKPSLAEIRAAVANALGKPARPNHLVTVSVMPTTASGKPDRKRLGRLVASRTQERRRRGIFG